MHVRFFLMCVMQKIEKFGQEKSGDQLHKSGYDDIANLEISSATGQIRNQR